VEERLRTRVYIDHLEAVDSEAHQSGPIINGASFLSEKPRCKKKNCGEP